MVTLTRRQAIVSPFLVQEHRIPGLPAPLQVVPSDPEEWREWRDAILPYREAVRRHAAEDKQAQALEMKLCAEDPAYWLTMYGVLFEPRSLMGNPPQWFRWVPFHFQIGMIRWIQECMASNENGRGDGLLEKSRDMGASWTMCAYIAHQFLFADAFVAGVVSRNSEQVDKTGSSDTLFYKLRALLGIEMQVPRHLRLPDWMKPAGMGEHHVTVRMITHPSKTCVIQGETTTAMSGVGGRSTLRFNDEAARFQNFDDAWANQGATSDHRFAISSADTVSMGFYEMAKLGREGLENPYAHAPAYLRLDWWVHPFHDEQWYRSEKARYAHDPHFFQREYEIEYFAGAGDMVYPRFGSVLPGAFPYEPGLGELYCSIDPGVKDPTAIGWFQKEGRTGRWRCVRTYQTPGGADPEFVASVLVGVPISGLGGFDYSDPELRELIAWTGNLRQQITYVGDHYGTHKGGDGKRSFYQALAEKSAELTDNQHVVHVKTLTADSARTFSVRKTALSQMAPLLDFDGNPSAVAGLVALKESRYPDRNPNRAYANEVLEPQHDHHSHMRTMFEYWAVNVSNVVRNEKVRSPRSGRGRRVTISGRIRR